MKKLSSLVLSALFLVAGAYSFLNASPTQLRKVECARLTVFTPYFTMSAEAVCRSHGGLATEAKTTAQENLVILMRDKPMGTFHGKAYYEADH
ncbi:MULTISPECIES: hypothetical protein [Pseudovibrio]|uniref:hypothetical protein n=1 Tax=Stappiaceae TaxID=2821832 RepID=UPI002366518D|nr:MULTISPECIES: hypothetical protein [Pseudovibrio]MDD7910472.1 hypothetical protein [Pseudovibrio exalbescens]MDX5594187.1 hypothetical protein [Pseudovibrio sp. SPO723]